MKINIFILISIASFLLLGCGEKKKIDIVKMRNAYKVEVFDRIEPHLITCNAKDKNIQIVGPTDWVISEYAMNQAIIKTDEGYQIEMNKIVELPFDDHILKLRLERIQNKAIKLYYEYLVELEQPHLIERTEDKGVIVCTCDAMANEE